MARRGDHIFIKPKEHHYIRGFFIWLLIAVFLTALVVGVMNYGTNSRVSVHKETVTVWNLPSALDGFTILHLSDLHGISFGPNQALLKTTLDAYNYKAVVMTGDMVGPGDEEAFLNLIASLKPGVPVYFITGDEDPNPVWDTAHGDASALRSYITRAQALGAIYVDVPTPLTVGKTVVWFCSESQYNLDVAAQLRTYQTQRDNAIAMGQADTPDGAAHIRALDYRIDQMNRLSVAKKQIQETDFQIVLAHEPLTEDYFHERAVYQSDSAMSLANATLAFSGHYCGGQWRLPWNNQALYVPELGYFPDERLYVGIGRIGGLTQHISPGLAASSIYRYQPGRLYNPPMATIIALSAK